MAFVESRDVDDSNEFYNGFDSHDSRLLEGDIAIPIGLKRGGVTPGSSGGVTAGGVVFNTLDEPISETILRDLKAVAAKFGHVLYPKQKKTLLRDWDLWGPLCLCIFLALMLEEPVSGRPNDGGGLEFAEVFVVLWLGAVVVTINSKLLGGTISFFQSVCVLGYCLVPQAISLIICRIILFVSQSMLLFIIRFLVTVVGFTWATFAAMVFLGESQPPNKRGLAVYPIFLFYFVISWMILSHSVNT